MTWWPRRWRTRLALVSGILLLVAAVPYLASRLMSSGRCVRILAAPSTAPVPDSDPALRVVSYNIAHGRGLAASNWSGGTAEQRLARLDRIAGLLRDLNADVVVLNEVDFDCSWSEGVNQARHLAERAGYPYRVEERNLDVRLLLTRWCFGNAVLSRHPISSAKVIDLPAYSQWEAALAGKKRGISCVIDVAGTSVALAAVHLEHRSEAIRIRSARMLLEQAAHSPHPLVIAGDLNSSPPGFPLSEKDHLGDNAMAVLDSSRAFHRVPQLPPGPAGHTFHAAAPDRAIDWILVPSRWPQSTLQVVASDLSDHRPVWMDINHPR